MSTTLFSWKLSSDDSAGTHAVSLITCLCAFLEVRRLQCWFGGIEKRSKLEYIDSRAIFSCVRSREHGRQILSTPLFFDDVMCTGIDAHTKENIKWTLAHIPEDENKVACRVLRCSVIHQEARIARCNAFFLAVCWWFERKPIHVPGLCLQQGLILLSTWYDGRLSSFHRYKKLIS